MSANDSIAINQSFQTNNKRYVESQLVDYCAAACVDESGKVSAQDRRKFIDGVDISVLEHSVDKDRFLALKGLAARGEPFGLGELADRLPNDDAIYRLPNITATNFKGRLIEFNLDQSEILTRRIVDKYRGFNPENPEKWASNLTRELAEIAPPRLIEKRPLQAEKQKQDKYFIGWPSRLGKELDALVSIVKCPESMAGGSLMSLCSFMAQGRVSVTVHGRRYPTSLFYFCIAHSGERKSTADGMARKSANKIQTAKNRQYKIDFKQYKKSLKDDNPLDPPENPTMILEDVTCDSLTRSYKDSTPSKYFALDEAAIFFSGHAMSDEHLPRTIGTLTKLWDGKFPSKARVGEGESFSIEVPRLAAHMMMQPIIAQKILSNQTLRQQGVLARGLFNAPESWAGPQRLLLPETMPTAADYELVASFNQRIEYGLNLGLSLDDDGEFMPKDIPLSSEAEALWTDFFNKIELQLPAGGKYHANKPDAIRAPDNAIRIAGTLTLYNDINATEVCIDAMVEGCRQALWHLHELMRIDQEAQVNPVFADAEELLEWMKEHPDLDAKIEGVFTDSYLSRKACGKFQKNKARRSETLALLVEYGWLELTKTQRNKDGWELT